MTPAFQTAGSRCFADGTDILTKVSSAWIFIHRQLLDYFPSKETRWSIRINHIRLTFFLRSLWELMKTLKTALVMVAIFAAMNATWMKADQPRMQRAIDLLRQARAEIQAASPTKGGHRTTAVEHINRAIEQLEKGMLYDRNH